MCVWLYLYMQIVCVSRYYHKLQPPSQHHYQHTIHNMNDSVLSFRRRREEGGFRLPTTASGAAESAATTTTVVAGEPPSPATAQMYGYER